MSGHLLILACVTTALTGCTGSRWARSDADYARKYSKHSDDVLQMAKQSLDARFVGGRNGFYTSVASGTEPATASAELGMLVMPWSWLETRVGATGIVGSPGESIYGGGTLGVRLQSPSRFSPFIGVGGYVGEEPWEILEDVLNENDDWSTETSDNDSGDSIVFAGYPELGAHFWLTPRWRLTTSMSYYVGWSEEPWFFSIGVAKIPGPDALPATETWIDDWLASRKSVNVSRKSVHGSSIGNNVTQRLPPVERL